MFGVTCKPYLAPLPSTHKAKRPRRGEMEQKPKREGMGTHENPIHYEHIAEDDPKRQEKLKKQREQFSKDAQNGKVLCLTDLFISHGL